MNIPQSYLRKNLFFYRAKQLYRVVGQTFEKVGEQDFLKSPFPVLVLARDSMTETVRKYPVTDASDLKEIIAQELTPFAMHSTPKIREHDAIVKIWSPDAEILQQLTQKLFIWVPESLLISGFEEDTLFKIERCNSSLYSFNDLNANYTANVAGAYKSPDYFLMSIGAPSLPVTTVNEAQYAALLHEQFFRLPKEYLLSILKGQRLGRKIAEMFSWRSMALGGFLGVVLFFLSLIGYYSLQINSLESTIDEQNIASVIKERRAIEEKRKVFAEFADQDAGDNFDLQMWQLFGDAMKQNISVLKVRTTDTGLWLRLQSDVATSSLTFIKNLPYIKSASFANAVQNFRGRQRFNINISFKDLSDAKVQEVVGE